MSRKWKKLYEMQINFVCPYCLNTFPLSKATKEHEPPKSRQKELGQSKIILACGKCNNEKGSLTALEYARWKTTKDYHEWERLERIRHGQHKGVIR